MIKYSLPLERTEIQMMCFGFVVGDFFINRNVEESNLMLQKVGLNELVKETLLTWRGIDGYSHEKMKYYFDSYL